ncbi:MAG: biotin carboxylase N-terminal domain-containing protein [Pseudomonadales bacterium]
MLPTKVLIANRGAIARRVIEACDRLGIASVAVYSEADGGAPYLMEASQVLALAGSRAEETYLNQPALLAALAQSGADAVHPGYGFLAENADFADAVVATGSTFIGPAPRLLRTLGDKVAARRLAAERGFPVFPGSELLDSVETALIAADEIGFPLMLKPAAGGGGIGMRVVADANALRNAFAPASEQALRSFGDGGIYLEKWLAEPRHIEFQILADQHGNAHHLYERECSIQRRHQKIIEETPAPGIDAQALLELAGQAAALAGDLGYDNVGTVETLRTADAQYGFLEMNPRIQVEHAVTEVVTGVDLVAQQIRLAGGERLAEMPARQGFGLEVRIYAEHAVTQLPSTGRLAVFRPPRLHAVRVATGYQEGQWVSPYYDPLLAKVIGRGSTREQAIGRVLIALKGFAIQGVHSNIPLLLGILQDEEFLAGQIDTGYLPRFLNRVSKGVIDAA